MRVKGKGAKRKSEKRVEEWGREKKSRLESEDLCGCRRVKTLTLRSSRFSLDAALLVFIYHKTARNVVHESLGTYECTGHYLTEPYSF